MDTKPTSPEPLPNEGPAAPDSTPISEPGPAPTPEKLRLEPTRYGDWELNGKCVDF